MESHVLVLGTMLELPLGNKLSCSCRGNVSLSLPDIIIERQNSDGHGELGEAVEGQCGRRRRGPRKGDFSVCTRQTPCRHGKDSKQA